MKEINIKSNEHYIKLREPLSSLLFCSRLFNFKLTMASSSDTFLTAINELLYDCGFESSHLFAPEEVKF
jgi:hypothetical protein